MHGFGMNGMLYMNKMFNKLQKNIWSNRKLLEGTISAVRFCNYLNILYTTLFKNIEDVHMSSEKSTMLVLSMVLVGISILAIC